MPLFVDVLNFFKPVFSILPVVALVMVAMLGWSMLVLSLVRHKKVSQNHSFYPMAVQLRKNHKLIGISAVLLMLLHALYFSIAIFANQANVFPFFGVLNVILLFLVAIAGMQISLLRKTTPYDAKATKKVVFMHVILLSALVISIIFHANAWFGR